MKNFFNSKTHKIFLTLKIQKINIFFTKFLLNLTKYALKNNLNNNNKSIILNLIYNIKDLFNCLLNFFRLKFFINKHILNNNENNKIFVLNKQ